MTDQRDAEWRCLGCAGTGTMTTDALYVPPYGPPYVRRPPHPCGYCAGRGALYEHLGGNLELPELR